MNVQSLRTAIQAHTFGTADTVMSSERVRVLAPSQSYCGTCGSSLKAEKRLCMTCKNPMTRVAILQRVDGDNTLKGIRRAACQTLANSPQGTFVGIRHLTLRSDPTKVYHESDGDLPGKPQRCDFPPATTFRLSRWSICYCAYRLGTAARRRKLT